MGSLRMNCALTIPDCPICSTPSMVPLGVSKNQKSENPVKGSASSLRMAGNVLPR